MIAEGVLGMEYGASSEVRAASMPFARAFRRFADARARGAGHRAHVPRTPDAFRGVQGGLHGDAGPGYPLLGGVFSGSRANNRE